MSVTILNTKSNFVININLLNPEYESLLPDKLPSFVITEKKRICDIYPDGLFPGATADGPNNQVSPVLCFFNYLEWSRITSDDVDGGADDGTGVNGGDNQYLTTAFFDSRNKGWKSITPLEKPGETIGYCFNGIAYHTNNVEIVRKTVYTMIYGSIIKTLPAYQKLKEFCRMATVNITGADIEVLRALSLLLS